MHCINFRGEIFKITSMLSYSGCYIQTFWKSEASEDSVWILQICRLPLNWWIINQLSIIDNCWKLYSLIFMYAIPGCYFCTMAAGKAFTHALTLWATRNEYSSSAMIIYMYLSKILWKSMISTIRQMSSCSWQLLSIDVR